jgi:hypothetical protein
MKHEKTIIHFTSKGKSYHVEYGYSHTVERSVLTEKDNDYKYSEFDYDGDLQARVYENDICIRLFDSIPSTKTKNSTKSQAKELISIALRDLKKQKKLKTV